MAPPRTISRAPRGSSSCSLPQEASIVQKVPLIKLVVDFLPSIFISGVNFVLPPVFKLIAPLEGYTQSHQVIFILLRFRPPGGPGGGVSGPSRGPSDIWSLSGSLHFASKTGLPHLPPPGPCSSVWPPW